MFKILVPATQNTVSDAGMEFPIHRRLSWLRLLAFDLSAVTPDENTLRLFREKLKRAEVVDGSFAASDRQLRHRGHPPTGGQAVDATLVPAAKQRNAAAEKEAIRAVSGRCESKGIHIGALI